MDKLYEIIINSENVELFDPNDLDLAITSAVSDANNLTVRKSSNTKVIKVPASGPNKILFGHPHDINSIVSINQLTKPTVIILADGTQIFKGYAKISGSLELNNIAEYEITCIGTNGDWIGRIGGAKLSDLDYSDQNHTIDHATILASEMVAVGREYVYDFIDRGKFSGQGYVTNTESVNISDRKPAISMASFVKRIYASIGYVVVSEFIDSAFFEALYWPFVNDKINIDPTFTATFLCEMEQSTTQYIPQNSEQRVLNSGNYTNTNPSGAYAQISGSAYYVKCSGKYKLEGYVNVTFAVMGAPASDNISFNIMKKNIYSSSPAITIYNENYELTAMDLFTGSGTHAFQISPDLIWGTYDLEFGDEIYYLITARSSDVTITGNRYSVQSIIGTYGGGEGQPFDFNLNLPDTLQLDFLQGLKELFNLHFNPDIDSRRIIIEPYDDFYSLSPEDWSNKLDKGRSIQILFTGGELSKTISYRYKNDSNDKFVEDWQKQTGKFLGSEEAVITNVFAKDETLIIENKVFAATWMQLCDRVGLTNTAIPRMWSDAQLPPSSTKFLPRILFYDGVKSLPSGETWKFNQYGTVSWQAANLTAGIRTDYPRFFSYDDSAVNNNNLFFQDRTYSSGLFQKHFRNAQNSINDGRNFIAYMNLRDVDMSNLNHQKPKYIEDQGNGAYFILDKVDNYKSQDNITTRCYFVKVVSRSQIKKLAYVDGLFVTDSAHQHREIIIMNEAGTEVFIGGSRVLILDGNGNWVPDTDYVGYI